MTTPIELLKESIEITKKANKFEESLVDSGNLHSIRELDLSDRTDWLLSSLNICSVEKLLLMKDYELANLPGIGRKTLEEIESALHHHKLFN
jgi:DNA-directed RNA polymerase alpha subunit